MSNLVVGRPLVSICWTINKQNTSLNVDIYGTLALSIVS